MFLTIVQVLAKRESEAREFHLNITELEANINDLKVNFHAQFEATLEQEAEEKYSELRAAIEEIEHLGKQVYALEEHESTNVRERKTQSSAIQRFSGLKSQL
ncbi:hypothetical protein EDB19DRAFT_2046108 [Suillus lakei]|nr:hypothetical protein EDB19DRAFT_2046108 [Suillus lakei]